MKSRIIFALALLGTIIALVPALPAQRTSEIRKASIPFTFYVENHRFPAGDYEVAWIGTRLSIHSLKGNHQALVIANRVDVGKPNSRNALRFTTYGGTTYFLSQVWIAGDEFGRELLPSNTEREYADKRLNTSYAMVGLHK